MPPRIPSAEVLSRSIRFPLSPSLQRLAPSSSRHFSSTESQCYPRKPRNNPERGMSAIRGTGIPPWLKLSVTKADLGKTRKESEIPARTPTENHGLWGFFNQSKTLLTVPHDETQHGRSWTVEELRKKSFNDLHSLWWICTRERNRIATERYTRKRLKAGYGEVEASGRERAVKDTMKAIKQALTERFYAWEDARKLASADPTISVNEDGITYGNAEEDFEEEEEEESNDERKLPEAVYEPATIKDGEGRKKDITA